MTAFVGLHFSDFSSAGYGFSVDSSCINSTYDIS